MTRLLVINLARFGDIIQSRQLLQALKMKNPNSHLALMVNKNFASACSLLSEIDELITLDFTEVLGRLFDSQNGIASAYALLNDFFEKTRQGSFDRIINITPHYLGLYSSFLSNRYNKGFIQTSDWEKFYIMITRNWSLLPFHLSDLYVRMAGLSPVSQGTLIKRPSSARDCADRFLHSFDHADGRPLIGLIPGSSEKEKQWPPQYFVSLARRLATEKGARIVLFGSGADRSVADVIQRALGGSSLNAVDKTGFDQLPALMSKMQIVITNDTGPLHVAAASGPAVISIHMGKETCFSTGPYGPGHVALQPRIDCHPCRQPRCCPNRICANMVGPDLVFDIAAHMLSGPMHPSMLLRSGAAPDQAVAYVSGFDSAGYLNYLPLWNEPLTMDAACRPLLRTLWDIALSSRSDFTTLDEHVNRTLQNAAGELALAYSMHDLDNLESGWRVLSAHAGRLRKHARAGLAASNAILCIERNGVRDVARLKHLSHEIEKIEDYITSIGATAPHVASFTEMYRVEKGFIRGETIAEMARETSGLFDRLSTRCEFFVMLGNTFFSRLLNQDRIRRAS